MLLMSGVFLVLYGGVYDRYFSWSGNVRSSKATLRNFSFRDYYVLPAGWQHAYYINLNEDTTRYQIIAEFKDIFNRQAFEKMVRSNDSIYVQYFHEPGFFGPSKNILLSVKAHGIYFMQREKSEPMMKDSNNFSLIAGIVIIPLGMILRKMAAKLAKKLEAEKPRG